MMKKIRNSQQLRQAIIPHHERLQSHPIYKSVSNMEQQKIFMQSHVWAVFDFMTLLKTIQTKVTCVSVPWVPPLNRKAAYLINQMVQGEESDDLDTGDAKQAISHYELYLKAMHDIGSDSQAIEDFVILLRLGIQWDQAANQIQQKHQYIPKNTIKFVKSTYKTASLGEVHEVASAFLYGREDPIPKMFTQFLTNIKKNKLELPNYEKYLQRHIELDGDHHSHMAEEMLADLIQGDEMKYEQAYSAAVGAIEQREMLWDGIYQKITIPKFDEDIPHIQLTL